MDYDDKTPVAEEKPIPVTDGRSRTGASTPSYSGEDASTTSSSGPPMSGNTTTSEDSQVEIAAGGGGGGEQEQQQVPTTTRSRPSRSCAASDMSASYHEIFDTQMPPETARAEFMRQEEERELIVEAHGVEGDEDGIALNPLLLSLCDTDTEATTNYLTSKLVRDSLRWQNEHAGRPLGPSPSPCASPRRRPQQPASGSRNAQIATSSQPNLLDPNYLIDLENDARHLATSVDSLVENLAGVLHNISALTVEAVETYR